MSHSCADPQVQCVCPSSGSREGLLIYAYLFSSEQVFLTQQITNQILQVICVIILRTRSLPRSFSMTVLPFSVSFTYLPWDLVRWEQICTVAHSAGLVQDHCSVLCFILYHFPDDKKEQETMTCFFLKKKKSHKW